MKDLPKFFAEKEPHLILKCFAFFDGTVRPICRPGTVNQRLLYNGHKRIHGIKFQSVVTPDGMIANMYGPVGKLFFFLENGIWGL